MRIKGPQLYAVGGSTILIFSKKGSIILPFSEETNSTHKNDEIFKV